MHHETIHHRKNMMPKWECGRGRKSPSATAQNDTDERTRGDGSDKRRAKQEKCDELRCARVIGAADAEARSCTPYVSQMTADTTTQRRTGYGLGRRYIWYVLSIAFTSDARLAFGGAPPRCSLS
ncbi:hypothetical protein B0H13DRAFT_2651971 [Mycena leptocephala]|nr:hypothetical protein B0H13DRAFT_2651971 [Mycena leptocephala]